MVRQRFSVLVKILVVVWGPIAFCRSYTIKPGVWKYKGHPIAWEKVTSIEEQDNIGAGERNKKTSGGQSSSAADPRDSTPLLLLNGFGVGSFHQHRLVQQLMRNDDHRDRTIYCIDYLGQGKSWPENCQDGNSEAERGLRYCGETWIEQLTGFIEEVIRENSSSSSSSSRLSENRRVHIVGNSVGGHLAVCIAAMPPDLVESLCLLNPTPVWGLNLPGWSGHLPAPFIPKQIGRILFDRIRDMGTISSFLKSVYVNPSAYDEHLMHQIRQCTEGEGGHAAFASILWSPPVSVPLRRDLTVEDQITEERRASFDQCLRVLECDVLLVFGAEDPWIKPAFGKRMMRDLSERPTQYQHRYVELSRVGHCPNHEAPVAVAQILSKWLDPPGTCRSESELHLANQEVAERWGETILSERKEDEIPLSLVDRLAITFV